MRGWGGFIAKFLMYSIKQKFEGGDDELGPVNQDVISGIGRGMLRV